MTPDAATTLEMMPWLEGLPPFVIRAVVRAWSKRAIAAFSS
jgi:hypothetical protein